MRILELIEDWGEENRIFIPSYSISKFESTSENECKIYTSTGEYEVPLPADILIYHLFIDQAGLNNIIFSIKPTEENNGDDDDLPARPDGLTII